MGDRVSIRFTNGEEASPFLFSHWDGMSLLTAVYEYLVKLCIESAGSKYSNVSSPIDRLEPGTVMVDFICYRIKRPVTSNYYLTTSENEGDNSDNGHYDIELSEKKMRNIVTIIKDKILGKEDIESISKEVLTDLMKGVNYDRQE